MDCHDKKSKERRGKVQLIDGSSKSNEEEFSIKETSFLAKKRPFRNLQKNQEDEFCKIYDNHFFGYTKVTIDQPLIEEG